MNPEDEETLLGNGDEEKNGPESEETFLGTDGVLEEPGLEEGANPAEPLIEENIPSIRGVRCERYLGKGAAGAVFLVRQEKLSRWSALKLLHEHLGKDRGFRRRFNREGQILAQMDHPNIVRVYDVGEAEGQYYLLLEFVDGGNLEDHLQLSGGNLEAEEVRQILHEVLEALAYAHRSQIVHCDLKPMNLLRTSGGRTKISDFGIAKAMGTRRFVDTHAATERAKETSGEEKEDGEATVIEETEAKKKGPASPQGTLDYMAPEVRAGQNPSARSDLFAVGVIAYYLLTGKKPYGKYRPASKLARGVHRRWDSFIDQCLVNEPAERMPSARRALQALEAIPKTGRSHGGRLAFLTMLLLVVFTTYAWRQQWLPGEQLEPLPLTPEPVPAEVGPDEPEAAAPPAPAEPVAAPSSEKTDSAEVQESAVDPGGQALPAEQAFAVGDRLLELLPRRQLQPEFALLDENGVTTRRIFNASEAFGLQIEAMEDVYGILLTYLGDEVFLVYPGPGNEPFAMKAQVPITTKPVPPKPPFGPERIQLVTASLPKILEEIVGFFGSGTEISARKFQDSLYDKSKNWGNPATYGPVRSGAADIFLFIQPPTSTDSNPSP